MDHEWPDELVTGAECHLCGLDYGQWSDDNEFCPGDGK